MLLRVVHSTGCQADEATGDKHISRRLSTASSLFSEKLHPIQCKNLAAPENAPTMVHKIFHCAESCTSSSASNIVALATNWDELALFSCLSNYFFLRGLQSPWKAVEAEREILKVAPLFLGRTRLRSEILKIPLPELPRIFKTSDEVRSRILKFARMQGAQRATVAILLARSKRQVVAVI